MGQKILVVEDNELNLRLFCDLLRAHGYEAEPVRDGREAVERARSAAGDPDCLLQVGQRILEVHQQPLQVRHAPAAADKADGVFRGGLRK